MSHHDFDVAHALEEVAVPAAIIDRHGRFRWLNRAAIDVVGERVGQPFVRGIAPEDLHVARTQFAKTLIGDPSATDFDVPLIGRAGQRSPGRIPSAPSWEDSEITGGFGLAIPTAAVRDQTRTSVSASRAPQLTARQHEVLTLVADGCGTAEIATRLGIAEETARNRIRNLLRQLGAHSRLEAVARAYRLGILQPLRDPLDGRSS